MKQFFIVIVVSLICTTAFSKGKFDFSPTLQQAYNRVLDLKLVEAQSLVNKERKENPNNLLIHYVENYIDFYTILVNQNEAEFKRLEARKDKRMKAIENGDFISPYYLYAKAEILLQWAFARGIFGEYYTSLRESRKAYRLLETNRKQFPEFKANIKSLGVLKTVFSNVPESYQWITNALGIKGDFDGGMKDIKYLLNYAKHNDFLFERETLIMYSFTLSQLGNADQEAWDIINNKKLDPKKSLLVTWFRSYIGMRVGHNDIAINLLKNRPKGNGFYDVKQLEFLLAKAKLQRLDTDADKHFVNYLNNPQGNNYLKATYYLRGLHYLIHDNEVKFKQYTNKAKTAGTKLLYEDKWAMDEVGYLSGSIPNKELMKARLLFDGGYYNKANILLSKVNPVGLSKNAKIEYAYRKGRTLHSLDKISGALQYYTATIRLDNTNKTYYKCVAALQSGFIYENKKDYTQAIKHFKIALATDADRYKYSLHQQAKAGVQRIESLLKQKSN